MLKFWWLTLDEPGVPTPAKRSSDGLATGVESGNVLSKTNGESTGAGGRGRFTCRVDSGIHVDSNPVAAGTSFEDGVRWPLWPIGLGLLRGLGHCHSSAVLCVPENPAQATQP